MNRHTALFVIAALLALLSAFVMIPAVDILFVLFGIALGLFAVRPEARPNILLAAIALTLVSDALAPLPLAGLYLSAFLANFSAMLNAAAVVVVALLLAAQSRH